jgi:hypothetical protein
MNISLPEGLQPDSPHCRHARTFSARPRVSFAVEEHADGRDKHGHDDKGMKDIERRLAGTVSKREPDSRATSTGMTKEE